MRITFSLLHRRKASGTNRISLLFTNDPRQPLSQFFQIKFIHSGNKIKPVNIMDRQNVILVKDDHVTLIQAVKSCFNQWIIHDAAKKWTAAFRKSDPEILTPTTGSCVLFWKRQQ